MVVICALSSRPFCCIRGHLFHVCPAPPRPAAAPQDSRTTAEFDVTALLAASPGATNTLAVQVPCARVHGCVGGRWGRDLWVVAWACVAQAVWIIPIIPITAGHAMERRHVPGGPGHVAPERHPPPRQPAGQAADPHRRLHSAHAAQVGRPVASAGFGLAVRTPLQRVGAPGLGGSSVVGSVWLGRLWLVAGCGAPPCRACARPRSSGLLAWLGLR